MDLEVVEEVVKEEGEEEEGVDCQYPQQEDEDNCMNEEGRMNGVGCLMISLYIRVRAINPYLTLILMSTIYQGCLAVKIVTSNSHWLSRSVWPQPSASPGGGDDMSPPLVLLLFIVNVLSPSPFLSLLWQSVGQHSLQQSPPLA